VGTDVKGPTCIFEDCISGGDLAADSNPKVALLTVPAVERRLLRFTGNLLHAVPRPTDIWLLPFVQGTPDFTPSLFERSVVLFNTWQEPPLGLLQLLEEQQQECHRVDGISVSPRNEWTEVDIEEEEVIEVEVEEEYRGMPRNGPRSGCCVICNDAIITCELSTSIRMRSGCEKPWSVLRNQSELSCKQQPRPAKKHTCC
jgi:hypothetical protein